MVKIAIPNKGSLSEDAIGLISESGYKCKRYGSELVLLDKKNDIEFYFLRPRDIAIYVGNGFLDLGITGRDLALDSGTKVHECLSLNFGQSSFYYAVPQSSSLTPDGFNGLRIATSYPHIVELDMERRGLKTTIVELDGAVEISIKLGVADAIADVVQSGRTLTEAGLKTVGEPILVSEALLIAHSADSLKNIIADTFVKRLKGIIVAREFVMVEYDIPKDMLQKACAISPGIESPTISPLSKENWYAVKSMIKKNQLNSIMDNLADIGAKGIIVTDIRTCRI
ncbi:MAG: ATP phosphoribosyltransferase [Fibrobacterota bacterium]|nr:ATP phosphoribosyltransferase [Chitinispirillaceae bacterium]